MEMHGVKLMDTAYSIPEFCNANRISEGYYFKLRARGEAPDEMRIGRRVIVTAEALAKWRKEREVKRATPPQGEAA
jgi:hypothetical protein